MVSRSARYYAPLPVSILQGCGWKKFANISLFPLQQFLMVHQLVQKAAFRRRFKVNGVLVTHHLGIVTDSHRPVVPVFAYCHRQEVLVFAYCHRPVVLVFAMIEFAIYLAKIIRCWARDNSNHKKMGLSCWSCLSQWCYKLISSLRLRI